MKKPFTWIPWILIALSFAAAIAYTRFDATPAQHYAAGIFGAALGAALLTWGIEDLLRGRVRGKRSAVDRSDSPAMFFLLLVGTRFAPGLAMLGAAAWITFFGKP